METIQEKKTFYLYPGMIYAERGECIVTTVLGSCISVCLYDPVNRVGGINHYMLPLWNGEGLPSPKYGNIAISKLIEKMLSLGCRRDSLKAKVFGGGAVIQSSSGLLDIGARNIMLCQDLLGEERIPVLGSDVGGTLGRKLLYNTETGEVYIKKIRPSTQHEP